MKSDRSLLGRYAACLLAMGLAVAGRAWAEHMGWGPYRFPFVQTGIILSAALGGIGPGMLAVVLGTFAWFMFLPPVGKFWLEQPIDLVNLIAFAAVNVLIVWAFATARQGWVVGHISKSAPSDRQAHVSPPSLGSASPAARPHLLLRSPAALVALLVIAVALAAFGCWGMFSAAGTARFDDETTLIPLTSLCLAPAILIFGLGFLPVFSFHTPTPTRRAGIH